MKERSAPQGTDSGSDIEYAGRGQRLGAWLVDGLLTWIPLFVVASVFGAIVGDPNAPGDATDELVGGVVLLLGSPLLLLYHTLFRGRTPGKRMLGIAAVDDAARGTLGYGRAFARALITFFFWVPLFVPALLDSVWPLWDRKRQALHDKMAATVVVRADGAPVSREGRERSGRTELIRTALWLCFAATFVLALAVPLGVAADLHVRGATPLASDAVAGLVCAVVILCAWRWPAIVGFVLLAYAAVNLLGAILTRWGDTFDLVITETLLVAIPFMASVLLIAAGLARRGKDVRPALRLAPVVLLVAGGFALALGAGTPAPLLLSMLGLLAAPFLYRRTSADGNG
jgi:hypothetical protein